MLEDLIKFIQAIELWVYGILGIFILFFLVRIWSHLRTWRGAIFGLERQMEQRRFVLDLTALIILTLIGIAEFTLVSFVVPSIPQTKILPTATINAVIKATLPGVSSNLTSTPTSNQILRTPTAVVDGCIPGQIEWTFPKAGGQLKGIVELKGTVNISALGFYKYEYSKMGADTWVTIAAGNEKKVDKVLGGAWNTSQLNTGDYLLRLVVADNQNRLMPACIIQIRIIAP